jgi:hypothetical protein
MQVAPRRSAEVQSRGVGSLRETRPMRRRRESTGSLDSVAYSRVWSMERVLGPIPTAPSTGTTPRTQGNAQRSRAMGAQGLMP